MDKILVEVRLPCSAAQLESALLKAAHVGHWHDALVTTDDDNHIIVSCPEELE